MSRPVVSVALAIAVLGGCGGGERAEEKPSGAAARPSGKGACALLMQAEVDAIFGSPVGAGASESLDDGSELCVWPTGEDPALLLQVGPAVASVEAAVDLGEGYRVHEVSGMSGPAAAAIEIPSGEGAAKPLTVAVLAITVSGKTVTISPVGLGIPETSERFEKLKSLVEAVVKRM